jgi:hypothetical protein
MSRATALGALKENDNRKKAPLALLDRTSETDLKQCADGLFRLVVESHNGRALVPIPKRSKSPRATSALADSLKALDRKRPIREADMPSRSAFGPEADMNRHMDARLSNLGLDREVAWPVG